MIQRFGVVRSGLALCAFGLVIIGACSDPDRSAGHFCAELQAELPALTTAPSTPKEVDRLVARFKRLNRMTPLAIEEQWQILTDLVDKAADVTLDDPTSRQELADAAYKAERPTRELTSWVEATCGYLMPDVIGIEGARSP